MRIGIDIDDVITETSLSMKKYILKYDTGGEVSKHIEEIMRGEIPTDNVKTFIKDSAINIMVEAEIKENAREVINELLKSKQEIFLITSRGEERYKGSEKITLEYLKSNKIEYTHILFNSFKKDEICQNNCIDIMIDDSVKLCMKVQLKGIKSILFTSLVNKSIKTDLERVDNWIDLEKKINAILNKREKKGREK